MSVTTTTSITEQAGNGVLLAFDFAFKIVAAADLIVKKSDADGDYTAALTLGVDYTVVFDTDAQTGTVTYTVAPVSGGTSYIERSTPLTQSTIFPREGLLPAKTIEAALDKMAMQIQELSATLDAATLGTLTNPIRSGTFLDLDADANATPFLAKVTDTQTIMVFLGDRSQGANGWATIGGY